MFSLTRREQMVVAFIMVALLAGALIRHVRMNSQLPSALFHNSASR
ncbi:MAG: hypothetical protein ACOYMT_03245 [Chthoniobacterales bacterium]